MNVREAFLRCMRFEPTSCLPNFEMGYWGQTLERWISEGMPPEEAERGGFGGHSFFGLDDRPALPVGLGPIPPPGPRVIEETDRHIIARDHYGAVRKSLKEGTVRC